MAEIQVLVDKSPLPPGFSPVCDPLDSSEARVGGWGVWREVRPHLCREDRGEGWRKIGAISELRQPPDSLAADRVG